MQFKTDEQVYALDDGKWRKGVIQYCLPGNTTKPDRYMVEFKTGAIALFDYLHLRDINFEPEEHLHAGAVNKELPVSS